MFKINNNNYLGILMTFSFKTVPYTVTTLDSLLTIIYLNIRTKIKQSSIAIYGAKIWNSLDENLKSSRTLQNF